MKSFAIGVAFVCVVGVAQAQKVSPTDYTVPKSTAEQMQLGGTYNYAGQEGDLLTNDAAGFFQYNRFFSSLPYGYDLSLDVLGNSRYDAVTEKQDNSYNMVGTAGIRKYFNEETDFFYSIEGRTTFNDSYDRPAIYATPGLGYGRFIRATDLARAVRIEEFLIQENVIKGNLSKATMLELAHIIEIEGEYRAKYGATYRVQWFEDMEKAIDKSGKLTTGELGAVGLLRIEEVLFDERVNERFYGWDARIGVGVEVLTPFEDQERSNALSTLRVRYSRPLGWRSQFGFDGEIGTPLSGQFGKGLDASLTAEYLYELTNRVDWTAANVLTASRVEFAADEFTTSVSDQIRSGFIFYIENSVNLVVNATAAKEEGQPWNQGLNLSLLYRLK